MKKFFIGFAVVSLLIAGVLSYFASGDPDGLDKTVEDTGIAEHAQEHPLSDTVFADYAVGGDDAFTGLAGILGVVVVLALSFGLFWFLRKRTNV
ncbi:cobalt/nickel transport system permease protein/cobalt/nickel transport protein [Lentzea fradiae]|uniref:Cobalt/nickel transport system permease protein/cobalt/nickel transport protein n=1 Tax=Lentzea fradiae TaxID=200378 RepID=A0A1G7RLU1_9PSEU|nr:PDGLE domain-containing protein [Lentzea fradiae]SDG11655.1 cobalt/nickel transport system permease protein/cobalt/nickel transport protein [Lentzea fradiae]